MSKSLDATCQAGVVQVDNVPVQGVTVLGEGQGQSEGMLVLDEDKRWYVARTSGDLKSTLDQVIAALDATVQAIDKIASTFTDVGGGMAGSATAPPPTLPASVAEIQAAGAQVDAAKTALDTLKGQLK